VRYVALSLQAQD
jgi:hypothetical protein